MHTRADRQRQEATAAGDHDTGTVTNLELFICGEQMEKRKSAEFNSRVSVEIINYRTTLADSDGVSAKAAIDGLVNCGILRGDSTKEIQEPIRSRQVKVKNASEEKTVIVVEEV